MEEVDASGANREIVLDYLYGFLMEVCDVWANAIYCLSPSLVSWLSFGQQPQRLPSIIYFRCWHL